MEVEEELLVVLMEGQVKVVDKEVASAKVVGLVKGEELQRQVGF